MQDVYTFEQLFDERLLRIPAYQRGYAWDRLQLQEFIDDLELLGKDRQGRDRDHYTGTVILHPISHSQEIDAEGKAYSVTNVVDGQQRLTTIVLLLNAIRREMEKQPELKVRAEGIHKRYVATQGSAGLPLHKLTLNRDTNEYWIRSVLTDEPSLARASILSHRRLDFARAFFAKYLERRKTSQEIAFHDWLVQLSHKVTHQLKVTLYNVSDTADVGVIFETMNGRGKDLTELEMVKNYILYVSSLIEVGSEDLTEAVNRSWTEILENLMRAGLSDYENQLLRAHWLMAYDPQSRDWKGSKSIKNQFSLRKYQDNHEALLVELLAYVGSLEYASQAFCDVQRPDNEHAFTSYEDPSRREEVRSWSERLRRTDQLSLFIPLLLATRLRFPRDPGPYLEILNIAERFAFRVRLLVRQRQGGPRLSQLAHRVYREQTSLPEATREIAGLALGSLSNRAFEAAFDESPGGNWYKWKGIRYFLYEYEEHVTGPKQVKLEWNALEARDKNKTIEHILPQTPTDSYWQQRFTEEEIESLTNDLGNLVLTQDNSAYGNKPFDEKKGSSGKTARDGTSLAACYANATLQQEKLLTRYEDWTVDALRDRRQELIAFALQRWRMEETPAIEPDPDEEEDTETDLLVLSSADSQDTSADPPEPEWTETPRGPRRKYQTWDDYLAEYDEDFVQTVKELVEPLEGNALVKSPHKLWIKFYPASEPRTDKTKIIEVVLYNRRPRLVAFGVSHLDPVHDPFPQLSGKRGPDKAWYWDIDLRSAPLDMTEFIALVQKHSSRLVGDDSTNDM